MTMDDRLHLMIQMLEDARVCRGRQPSLSEADVVGNVLACFCGLDSWIITGRGRVPVLFRLR